MLTGAAPQRTTVSMYYFTVENLVVSTADGVLTRDTDAGADCCAGALEGVLGYAIQIHPFGYAETAVGVPRKVLDATLLAYVLAEEDPDWQGHRDAPDYHKRGTVYGPDGAAE